MLSLKRLIVGPMLLAVIVAGCSAASQSQTVQGATNQPAAGGGSGSTIVVKNIGGQNLLVAGSNGMTVYTFANDQANSGKSNCNNGCIQVWPALTVPSGTTPTAGAGVSGKLGTITRQDGSTQVTYNGLPLYFYQGDHAAGDTNGHYPSWNLVTP